MPTTTVNQALAAFLDELAWILQLEGHQSDHDCDSALVLVASTEGAELVLDVGSVSIGECGCYVVALICVLCRVMML
jgi:hypothetical protein